MLDWQKITTLGALKATSYKPQSVKEELRTNLIEKLKAKEKFFEGILGFDDTVLPDLERAILSKHNILLLGLRGQAKTRIARLMTQLLDEWMPVITGSAINDDPLQPISRFGIDKVAELGDETPIHWIHRADRYVEKLATPDVSIADLVGDVDPIKAANLRLDYSDERVIHFGLIPRAHRCLFVINELPDLQARIQVSLFNILQEGDIQIRGFKLRMPLDIQFVFTANPEDYTNRGSIITPLKDRIESQILTHYPREIETGMAITAQEANISPVQREKVQVSNLCATLLEQIAFEARASEYIDEKSGVSARLTIAGYENLVATAERRALINGDEKTEVRITDFWGVIPAITGKVELVYEGEQEGPYSVALSLYHAAIRKEFLKVFPHPDKVDEDQDPYGAIKLFFGDGNALELLNDDSNSNYENALKSVAGLERLVKQHNIPTEQQLVYMELVIQGLATLNVLNKEVLDTKMSFRDVLANMLGDI